MNKEFTINGSYDPAFQAVYKAVAPSDGTFLITWRRNLLRRSAKGAFHVRSKTMEVGRCL